MSSLRVKLVYPDHMITIPVISRLAMDFRVLANIRRAAVDADTGWIVCELEGSPEDLRRAQEWLISQGVHVEALGDVVES